MYFAACVFLYIYNIEFFAAKSGVEPAACVELAKHVKLGCSNLIFSGLMTIGMPDYTSTPENFRVILTSLNYQHKIMDSNYNA